jgi:hypothetical protein
MARCDTYGRFRLKKEVTVDFVAALLKQELSKHYAESNITITATGIQVKGSLSDFWETAAIDASATVEIRDDELTYRVVGTASLPKWAWVLCVLGFVTGVFFVAFAFVAVEYLICRNRPKQYFDEAFDAVRFEIGALELREQPDEHNKTSTAAEGVTAGTPDVASRIMRLRELLDSEAITQAEFDELKRKIINAAR